MITLQDDAGRPKRLAGLATNVALALAVALSLAACGKGGAKDEHAAEGDKHAEHAGEKKDEHAEGAEELTLTAEEAQRAGVKVEAIKSRGASAKQSPVTATIRPDQDRLARVAPRIEGRITSVAGKAWRPRARRSDAGHLDSVAMSVRRTRPGARPSPSCASREADFKRAESLNAEEIIPRKDFLRAKSERDKAACRLRAAADRLRLLGGRKVPVGQRRLHFSVDGALCRNRHREEGHAGRTGQSERAPLFTMADLSRVWILADLPEAALAKVRMGANAKVTVPAYPGETVQAAASATSARCSTRTLARSRRASRWPMPTAA
jgi:cobalt-zinc-cadmium efflux system membrane fusion protein